MKKTRRPNLASQCLGLGLRELSSQWLNIAQNLALTRNALLAIIPFDEKRNLPSLIAKYQDDKTRAINLILHAKPIP